MCDRYSIADVGVSFPFQSDHGMEVCDSPSATAGKGSTAKTRPCVRRNTRRSKRYYHTVFKINT
jgi:hypothetical protein